MPSANFAVVGQPLPRRDGQVKATGEAKYAADLSLPGMLFGKVLRSPLPHARILNIDASRALRLRGVRAVVTGRDFPGFKYGFLPDTRDKLPLESERVRYVGDEVAAVAAVDSETAEEALELIQVDYEPLAEVFDPLEAMLDGAPQLHEHVKNNVSAQTNAHHGDVEAAFRQAHRIREDRFVTQTIFHGFLEPHAVLANWESTGKVTFWASKQSPYITWRQMARGLGMDSSQLRFIQPAVGGGFGGKHEPLGLDFGAVMLSRKTGRPVKIVYDQEEVFAVGRRRHAMAIDLKMSADKDGSIVAMQCRIVADGGAYASVGALSIYIPSSALIMPYRVQNLKYDGYRVYTNKPFAGALRGHTVPQSRFAVEQVLDMLAEDLGIDPVEIRLRNALRPGDVLINGNRMTSCALREAILKAAEHVGWGKTRARRQGTKVRGIGIGCNAGLSGTRLGAHDASMVVVKVHEDGRAVLMTGSTDVGQGSDTVLAQILAEELGLSMDQIDVATIDSDATPLDPGVFSSRVTFVSGNATRIAAGEVKRQIFDAVARNLEANPADLEMADHRVYVRGSPERGMRWLDAVRALYYGRGSPIMGKGSAVGGVDMVDFATGYGNQSQAYSFGAQIAEVEVDTETGGVRVLGVTAAHDCGQPINPVLVEGQMAGSAMLSLAQALFEDMPMRDGQTLSTTFTDYGLPTAVDAPGSLWVGHVDSEEPLGPFGAKEGGEAGPCATIAAIANAIYDATGVRVKDLPITPQRVLAALEAK